MAEWSQEQNKQIVLTDGPKWAPASFASLTLIVGPSFARVCGQRRPPTEDRRRATHPVHRRHGLWLSGECMAGRSASVYGYGVVVHSREIPAGLRLRRSQQSPSKSSTPAGKVLGCLRSRQGNLARLGTARSDTTQALELTFTPTDVDQRRQHGDRRFAEERRLAYDRGCAGLAVAGVATVGTGTLLGKRGGR